MPGRFDDGRWTSWSRKGNNTKNNLRHYIIILSKYSPIFAFIQQTSILMSILGHMKITTGHCYVTDSIAYVPQEAWIFSDSVMENILLGQNINMARYQAVIQTCGLQKVRINSNRLNDNNAYVSLYNVHVYPNEINFI